MCLLQLTNEEIKLVLEDFPKFELCYELIKHKKVYNASILIAIPEGKKCFTWFTNYKGNNICFMLELDEYNKVKNINSVVTGFVDKLVFGTIFYGTLFEINKNGMHYFCIEDLYYYKGKNYVSLSYLKKLETLRNIFDTEISQIALTPNYTVFGLPLINTDFNALLNDIQTLPYKINDIKFRYFDSKKIETIKYFKPKTTNYNKTTNNNNNKTNTICNDVLNNSNKINANIINDKIKNTISNRTFDTKYINSNINMIFKVTADIEPDIYNLFIYNSILCKEELYGIAFIPNYVTSVMMNKLFRKIKENDNLDAIEESDDETEFEDNREDKFVYLDRQFKMNCEYNSKFKRWCPVSLANNNDQIVSSNIIRNFNS
jgi:hypothetical protein